MDNSKIKKQIIIGIFGTLLSLAIFITIIIIEVGGRRGNIAFGIIGATLVFGFIGYAIDGIRCFLRFGGAVLLFCLNLLLIEIIPQPFKGIYIVFLALCFLAVPIVRNYLFDKEKNKEKKSNSFIAKKLEKIEEVEKIIDEEKQAFLQSFKHGENSILIHTLSDKYYQLIKGEENYYFVYVGNSFTGIKDDLMINDFTDESIYIKGKKDFFIPKLSISDIILKRKIYNENLPDAYTAAKINCPNKTMRINILYEIENELISFFDGIRIVDNRKKQAIQEEESDVELDKSKLSKLKLLNVLLNVAAILLSAILLFIPFAYRILASISLALPLIVILLYIKYNDYLTVIEFNYKKENSKRIFCLFSFFFPLGGLGLRAIFDFSLIGYTTFIIYSLIFSLIILSILLLFTREYRKIKSVIFIFIFLAVIYSPIFIVHTNAIFDTSEPVVTTSEVINMEISEGSDLPDQYHLEVTLASGKVRTIKVSEDFYNTINIGDIVEIYEYSGFWQIHYAFIKEE